MRVKPTTYPDNKFSGILYDKIWTPPDNTWQRLLPSPAVSDALPRPAVWDNLLAACPIEYRQIDQYAESPDRKAVVFRSKGNYFVYGDEERAIHRLHIPPDVPRGINSMMFEREQKADVVVLRMNGADFAKMRLKDLPLGRPVGIVPDSM